MPPKEGGGYDGGSFCQIGKGKAEQRKRCEVNHEHSFLPFLYSPESGARNDTLWGGRGGRGRCLSVCVVT